jgi:outer membrane protein assembly factor BamB
MSQFVNLLPVRRVAAYNRAMKSTCLIVCVAMLLAVANSHLAADDWPTYARDNQRTGVTPERLAPPLSLRWVFSSPFPPAAGWALPAGGYGARKNKPNVSHDDAFRVVCSGRTVYFCSSAENCVYAVDAATGVVRWRFFTGGAPRMAPVIWKGKVYFGADDGLFHCLDAETGRVVWKINCAPTDEQMLGHGRLLSLWPVRAGAIVEDGVAYFTAGLFPSEGVYFFAAEASSGRILWRKQLDAGGGSGPSPQGYMLSGADSIFMTSRVAPTRWSKSDGRNIALNTPIPSVKDAAYRFHNGGSYAKIWNGRNIVYGQGAILAYDPNKIVVDKYKREHKGDLIFNWFNARTVIFKGQRAYLATDYHILSVAQEQLPRLAANECREFEQAYKSHSVAHRMDLMEQYDRLVKAHGPDHPKALKMKSTSLKWGRDKWIKWPAVAKKLFEKMSEKCIWMTPAVANESMIMAGDVIYAGGADCVIAINAESGKKIWTARTASRVRGLAVANGHLFVSTIDGKVRCFARGDKTVSRARDKKTAAWPVDMSCGKHAQEVLDASGVARGYCLILGASGGQFAREIALRSKLRIEVLEPDRQKVDETRARLAGVGLYGGRVCVRQGDLKSPPYPPYIFNLVIDHAKAPVDLRELIRVTKPCGGAVFTALSAGSDPAVKSLNVKAKPVGSHVMLTRGKIPGARDWTHNYATAANTYCSEDPLVKGPFGVLWYGQPGPRKRVERHAAPPIPLVSDGIMFTTGYDIIMAYDIYNGVKYWERLIPGVTRTSLPMGTSNLVVDEGGLFVVVGDRQCLRLDARTGKTLMTYRAPVSDSSRGFWGWIAKDGPLLLGSGSKFDARRKCPDMKISSSVFAIDSLSGKLKWTHKGGRIEHDGIAVGGGRMFFVDSELTDRQRDEGLKNTIRDSSVEDRKPIDRLGKPIASDIRKLVVLDVTTGKTVWAKPFNATDITLDDTVVSSGRVAVACMYKDGVVVVHGTGSLGHPHREFLKGEFKRRAIYAFDARSGRLLWGGRKNYRKRPIIVGDYVYAEPFAWRLKTGDPKTIVNPLTGARQKLDFHRGYIGCGHLLASASTLFGAKGGIAWCDLNKRTGFTPFANMHLGCGLNSVPAGGVFVAPEGRSGCTCATPIWTSIALFPRQKARAWAIGAPGGMFDVRSLPVKHAYVNLGAPGYREESGRLWIPYSGRRSIGTGLIGKWLPTYQHNKSMFYAHSSDLFNIKGTETEWLYASGYRDVKPLSFILIDKADKPAKYTVRLHFAEPEDIKAGGRVFTVYVQGKPVLSDFDIVAAAGGTRKAIVKEFTGVTVTDRLKIHMSPSKQSAKTKPLLCAFEAIRE